MLSEKLERWRNAKNIKDRYYRRSRRDGAVVDAVGEAEEMEHCCVHGPGSTREGHRGSAWKLSKLSFLHFENEGKVSDTPMKKTRIDTVGEAGEIEQCCAAGIDRGTGTCQHVIFR